MSSDDDRRFVGDPPTIIPAPRPTAPTEKWTAAEIAHRCRHCSWFLLSTTTGALLVRWYQKGFEWLTDRAVPLVIHARAYRQMLASWEAYLDGQYGARVVGDLEGGPGTRPGWNRAKASAAR